MRTQWDNVTSSDVEGEWPSVETKREISSRRQELYDAMRQLEWSVAGASGRDGWANEVEKALTALHAALQRHVLEIEAEDGLFADVIGRAPHLAPEVAILRKLASSLVADWASPSEIRRKVLGILGRLAIHRQRGAELLFDTYNVDLAVGD